MINQQPYIRKLGESLVRVKIHQLNERVTELDSARKLIGHRVFRARLRYIKSDYTKLVRIARRYGFDV